MVNGEKGTKKLRIQYLGFTRGADDAESAEKRAEVVTGHPSSSNSNGGGRLAAKKKKAAAATTPSLEQQQLLLHRGGAVFCRRQPPKVDYQWLSRHGGRRGDARGGDRGRGRGDLPNEEAARQCALRDIENDDMRQQVQDFHRDIENGDLRQQSKPVYDKDILSMPVYDEPVYDEDIFSMPVYDKPVYDEDILSMSVVYDKPIYDEDILLMSESPPPSVKFDDVAEDEGIAFDDNEEYAEAEGENRLVEFMFGNGDDADNLPRETAEFRNVGRKDTT
ncbi:hypothetical protein SASPL_115131 [Salvia splendens]|uniref:Uncharacterized protein n=1 Tax=Salvia splendens TaxID=180675 RepID=A0A8X8Y7S1_SALSN|nr:hypothetical protein SASPL_115131 [Salvia splendens]